MTPHPPIAVRPADPAGEPGADHAAAGPETHAADAAAGPAGPGAGLPNPDTAQDSPAPNSGLDPCFTSRPGDADACDGTCCEAGPADVEDLADEPDADEPDADEPGGHRFIRPGQVAPDLPPPDQCVRCGRPRAEHPDDEPGAELAPLDAEQTAAAVPYLAGYRQALADRLADLGTYNGPAPAPSGEYIGTAAELLGDGAACTCPVHQTSGPPGVVTRQVYHQRGTCTDPVVAQLGWYADDDQPEPEARARARARAGNQAAAAADAEHVAAARDLLTAFRRELDRFPVTSADQPPEHAAYYASWARALHSAATVLDHALMASEAEHERMAAEAPAGDVSRETFVSPGETHDFRPPMVINHGAMVSRRYWSRDAGAAGVRVVPTCAVLFRDPVDGLKVYMGATDYMLPEGDPPGPYGAAATVAYHGVRVDQALGRALFPAYAAQKWAADW